MVDITTRSLSIKKHYTEYLKITTVHNMSFLIQRYKIQKWPPHCNSTKQGRERIHLHIGIFYTSVSLNSSTWQPWYFYLSSSFWKVKQARKTLFFLTHTTPGNNVTRFFHSYPSDSGSSERSTLAIMLAIRTFSFPHQSPLLQQNPFTKGSSTKREVLWYHDKFHDVREWGQRWQYPCI